MQTTFLLCLRSLNNQIFSGYPTKCVNTNVISFQNNYCLLLFKSYGVLSEAMKHTHNMEYLVLSQIITAKTSQSLHR